VFILVAICLYQFFNYLWQRIQILFDIPSNETILFKVLVFLYLLYLSALILHCSDCLILKQVIEIEKTVYYFASFIYLFVLATLFRPIRSAIRIVFGQQERCLVKKDIYCLILSTKSPIMKHLICLCLLMAGSWFLLKLESVSCLELLIQIIIFCVIVEILIKAEHEKKEFITNDP
jgi:hypothetical protein